MSEAIAPMTAKRMTTALWWKLRSASELIVPRFTPPKWWECDLWRLTKNGLTDEYEMKVSVADYRADFKKANDVHDYTGPFPFRLKARENKHEMLAAGDGRGPNRFWFVLTEEVAAAVTVPDYAGLLVAVAGSGGRSATTCYLNVVKPAPKLHGGKFAGSVEEIRRVFYWRFWNLEVRP